MDQWKLSLEHLLSDPAGVTAFNKHLEREFSSENLQFYLLCKKYEVCLMKDLKERAREIFTMFLSEGSENQIHLPHRERELIREDLGCPSNSTFDEAQMRISRQMEMDAYPRFLKSDIFLKNEGDATKKAQEKMKKQQRQRFFSCGLFK